MKFGSVVCIGSVDVGATPAGGEEGLSGFITVYVSDGAVSSECRKRPQPCTEGLVDEDMYQPFANVSVAKEKWIKMCIAVE